MEKLVNHNTKKEFKRKLRVAVEAGIVRAPSAPFEVPVLTTTNYPITLLETIIGDAEPLFVCDRRVKWSWMEKILSAKEQCARFKADGHKHFIYVDSDDGFLWQAPTPDICEKMLGKYDILFQRANFGFPRYKWFRGKMEKMLGHRGPCAGAFVARTDRFDEYCEIIIRLAKLDAPLVRANNKFDDQGAWKTLVAVINDRLNTDVNFQYLTRTIDCNYDEIL